MPAPKKPNTAAATEAKLRRGDTAAAKRLTARGYVVLSPAQLAQLSDDVRAQLDLPAGLTGEVVWQYSMLDPDEPSGRTVFVGTPRWISPRWERRPLRPAGPWMTVGPSGTPRGEAG